MKQYRLTARAEMHGEVRDPGYRFELEDGQKGPHRTVSSGPGDLRDEPLYLPVEDEAPAAELAPVEDISAEDVPADPAPEPEAIEE